MNTPSYYMIYGLHIRSEIPFHESSIFGEQDIVDVVVHKTEHLPQAERENASNHFDFGKHKSLLNWHEIGNFHVFAGNEIVIQPAPGVADHLLRPFLLAAVLPILLHQRGLLVLHASAVAMRDSQGIQNAVAFLGNSGQGKSTMATALHKRGHWALSDDVIAVPVSAASPSPEHGKKYPLIHAGLPHLKLRLPSVQAFDEDVNSLDLWNATEDSYVLRLDSSSSQAPVPLRCLYVLEDGDSIKAQLMETPEALMKLLEHSYGTRLLVDEGMAEDFGRCTQLAQQLPVFRLQRPRNFKDLPDVVRFVEEHQKLLFPTT